MSTYVGRHRAPDAGEVEERLPWWPWNDETNDDDEGKTINDD